MKKIIIALIGILPLSGCHIYQNYERPDVAVSDSLYRPSEWWSADTVSVAGLPWRELFRDTCLQALVAEGLRQNTDLQVARLKVEEAEATLMSSRLAFLSLRNKGCKSSSYKIYTLFHTQEYKADCTEIKSNVLQD